MIAAVLLAIASLITAYIIIGYPLLLARSFRRSAPPVRKDLSYQPKVSALMAVYNGEQFIREKLQSLLQLNYPRESVEILVVSDGSTDGTDAIVESFGGRGVRLIRSPRRGKAAALNTAMRQASGEILYLTDVRQTLHPDTLAHLAANFADPSAGAVTGEVKWVDAEGVVGDDADMEIYWRYELWARRRHAEIDSALNSTGCNYAVRRSLVEPIPEDTITDDAVIPLTALLKGYRVLVEPQAIAFDYVQVKGGEFRRKLRTLSGLWQVHLRLPGVLTGRNRMRLHYVSHKTGRLALPWAILLIYVATWQLPWAETRRLLLLDELLLPALALADAVIPKGFPLKRLSSPARSFLRMNLASLLSLFAFAFPSGRMWRPTQVRPPLQNS
jgi:cellulose synthase/poly-beta-1,6-N-acetylglucosamine synthase-like glycosyltransferase